MTNWTVSPLSNLVTQNVESSLVLAIAQVVLGLVLVAAFLTVTVIALGYAERKIAAHFQCRLGPMRVGWHGTLQMIADSIKLVMKEGIVPLKADKLLYFLSPFLCTLTAVLGLIIVPLSPSLQISDMNLGVFYVLAISGFGVLGILLGGWGSNNKWSLIGAMRAGAQIISYELSVTLAVLVIVLFTGSLRLTDIVQSQAEGWWIWRAPVSGLISFCLFIVASTAEINRTPFDLAEGESELTAGYHTEYSGITFAYFMLAEYVNLFVVAAIGSTLFLGGWMPFHIGSFSAFNNIMDIIPPGLWFAAKSTFLVFLLMWFRWTFPRLRVDQLMKLEWKIFLPLGLMNLLLAAVMSLFGFYFFPLK